MTDSAFDHDTVQVAFLGPLGTYSHQAAYDRFGGSVEYCEKETIADVFHALSPACPLAVIPQENSIFGSVMETYDLLRLPQVGVEKCIRGEITLGIQHCLVVHKGVELKTITRVLSHEQAIGQCRGFLTKYLPNASVVNMASTSAAAQALLSPDCSSVGCAAICSKLCTSIFNDLEVLFEGVQDVDANFTRFYILSTGPNVPLPGHSPRQHPSRALVRLSLSTESKQSCSDISRLLSAMALFVRRLDRRPSLAEMPFHDVYFAELQEKKALSAGGNEADSWFRQVQQGIERVKECGGNPHVLGTW